MGSNLKPGWADEAGRLAGEADRGDNLKPMAPGRHYIPVLPDPKPSQIDSIKRSARIRKQQRELSRKLDAVFVDLGDD